MAVVFSADFRGGGGVGVGMITFGELAHMVDAAQLCCLCQWTHARWYATMHHGGGWVGWGWLRSVNFHTWWMLRNCVACVRGHMLDATPQCIMVGMGMVTFGELAHMVDAMLLLVHGVKTCQVQVVSDFGKTRKVPVLPRRNARFRASASKSRVKQWKNRMEPMPIGICTWNIFHDTPWSQNPHGHLKAVFLVYPMICRVLP